jgi:hypothetical protein
LWSRPEALELNFEPIDSKALENIKPVSNEFFECYAEMVTAAETRRLSVASAIELEPEPAA